jgi:RNA recognition motif-containing protein
MPPADLFPVGIDHPVIHLSYILFVPLQGDSFTGFNGEAMETKLYVGNLAYSTTEEDLRALFAQAGSIKSVTIIKDRDTGRSKGFGFVEMETQAEAQQAISMFKETKLHERVLTVNLARPREERGGHGGFDRGRGGGRGGGHGSNRRDW